MISIVLVNRNRNLQTIKKSLDSLMDQINQDFELFFVDYGSNEDYLLNLRELLHNYLKINFISCCVSGQLWNKSRAINIAIKRCTTDYFFVADIDMLFRSDFTAKLHEVKKDNAVTYFQVGFLSKEESVLHKIFIELKPAFLSNEAATGMTLYPTRLLKEINGYDEFYNGWGAEDTDVHVRLKNLGIPILFYDKEILLKHQWHPKTYRTNKSTDAYHFDLEKINHYYLKIAAQTQRVKVNQRHDWGIFPDQSLYFKLERESDFDFNLRPQNKDLIGLLSQLNNFEEKIISIKITNVNQKDKIKELLKRVGGKKYNEFLSMDAVNNIILQEILIHYRNAPYNYSYDKNNGIIFLKIYLSK